MVKSETYIKELELKLALPLSANDVGEASHYFGMKIVHTLQSINLWQEKYVDTLVSDLGL